jgi:diaminopimelate epimerase
MHGAGNDFVLVDDRARRFPAHDAEWIRRIAARRTGIGCEGVILLQPPARGGTFRMRFFNPDGREAGMCGNGARCAARLAMRLGFGDKAVTIETMAGAVGAESAGEAVLLRMPPPSDWRQEAELRLDGRPVRYGFVNTGVPHAVILTADLAACQVAERGAAVRRHPDFAPAGTNVDFACAAGPHALRVRTYERGVEGETGACGTGIVAAALICARAGLVAPPVVVTPASGAELAVDFRLTADGAEGVTLTGPAEFVFEGELEYTP